MTCLIEALSRSALKKTGEKTTNNKTETQYLNLKAPSNSVKGQSDETLKTQILFFLTMQQMDVFPNETK